MTAVKPLTSVFLSCYDRGMATTQNASKLKPTDRFISARGDVHSVVFNRRGPKGMRFIRTNKCDFTVPNEVVCGNIFGDPQGNMCTCTLQPQHQGSCLDEIKAGLR